MLKKNIIALAGLTGAIVGTNLVADLGSIPRCALNCYCAISKYLECNETDLKCACKNKGLLVGLLEPCTNQYCSPIYSRLALSKTSDLCADIGDDPTDEEYSSAGALITSAAYYQSQYYGTAASAFSYNVTTPLVTTLPETTITSGTYTTTISSLVINVAEAVATTTGNDAGSTNSGSGTGSAAPTTSGGGANDVEKNSAASVSRLLGLGVAAVGGAVFVVLAL
ncbi:hypothetical protein F5Y16DRAFT_312669 [Xylariaceae sp. FL0255]|nr:hypothetical protein F5Y16DRAFT_312669 [Xylariaceae sp. FL0255]